MRIVSKTKLRPKLLKKSQATIRSIVTFSSFFRFLYLLFRKEIFSEDRRNNQMNAITIKEVKNKDFPDAFEEFIKEWSFFPPRNSIAKKILLLKKELEKQYFQKKYKKLPEKDITLYESNELPFSDGKIEDVQNSQLEQQNSDAESQVELFTGNIQDSAFDEEYIICYRKQLSQVIYNHLAMLADSPHALDGGAFSLREELTENLAGDIGLGLYLTNKIPAKLRNEISDVLYELAENFQDWFVHEKDGVLSTAFGLVCADEVIVKSDDALINSSLILELDVKQKSSFVVGK